MRSTPVLDARHASLGVVKTNASIGLNASLRRVGLLRHEAKPELGKYDGRRWRVSGLPYFTDWEGRLLMVAQPMLSSESGQRRTVDTLHLFDVSDATAR